MGYISFAKAAKLLKEKKHNIYTAEKQGGISQVTYLKVARGDNRNGGGDITTKSIGKFCALLGVQPGDLMEYIDGETRKNKPASLKQD